MRKITSCLFLMFFAFNIFSQVDLESGLVAYYPFNGNAEDESINDNHALTIQSPDLIDDCMGASNSAYLFDGISDYIEIPHNPAIDFDVTDSYAISIWIKPPVVQTNINGTINDIMSKWAAIGQEPYSFALRLYNQTSQFNGSLSFGRFDSNLPGCENAHELLSITQVNDDNWHNVILQKTNSGVLQLYVDGNLEDEQMDNSTCSVQNTEHLILGMRTLKFDLNVRRVYTGGMDNLRIYNRPLNSAEITAINDKTVSVSEAFDEKDLIVFPNPVLGNKIYFNNQTHKRITKVQLLDLNGQLMQDVADNQLMDLSRGFYFLNIYFEDQSHVIKKLAVLN